jgi:hypothetical protein
MNGLVSFEAFHTEASKSRHDDRLRQSKLVFNDGVHDGMQLRVPNPDPMPPMIFLRKADALLLIEGEPFVWRWVLIRVVLFHFLTFPQIPYQGTNAISD